MKWKLKGNEAVYSALAAYLGGGRLPHALLLEGPSGAGKKTLALEIAKAALCTADRQEKPCGVCRDCMKAEKGVHPDILVYSEETEGSRSFHVDAVRQLRSQAYIRPNEGSCKVLLLFDVHNMTVQAQNALLKIIEEPPEDTYFVLTCENKAAMLETILSRVSTLSLRLPPVARCAEILAEKQPGLELHVYEDAARQSGGNVGKALKLLSEESIDNRYYTDALLTLRSLVIGREWDALVLLNSYERDRAGFLKLLEQIQMIIQKQLVKDEGNTAEDSPLEVALTPLQAIKILGIMDELTAGLAGNVNGILLIALLCAKLKSVLV